MATRADRLTERLRGAQRTNLDDDDTFGLDIPGIGEPLAATTEPEPAPTTRATPGSAKRQRLDRAGSSRSTSSQDGSSGRRSARNRPQTASSLQDVPQEPSPAPRPSTSSTRRRATTATSSPVPQAPQTNDPDDELETLPAPRSSKSPATRASFATVTTDEVEESPANAPGSGRRRTRTSVAASASSVRLQDVLGSEEPAASSSPAARVAKRKSVAAAQSAQKPSRLGKTPQRRMTATEDQDDLSPENARDARQAEDVAETVQTTQTAEVLARQRPTRRAAQRSPNLGSGSPQAVEDVEDAQEPAPKRRKGRQAKSPAAQKQPTTKTTAKGKAARRTSGESTRALPKAKPAEKASKPAPKQRKRKSAAPADRNDDEEDEVAANDNTAVEITVQRFVNHKKRGGNDDEEDPLHSEIPFANRTGESTVDVLAQVCEEVISNTMGQFHELLGGAGTEAAKKKEYRIKMRAIDAYKEELNSRFLQHAIHLDHWHSLRKRVRHVQKEKLMLRDDILKLKAEREQVALRMDAIRTKHEADTKEATYRLDTSALMHDIELAVEEGQRAPKLSAKQQKEADLANLELLIAQVADQASSKSGPGGLLRQISDFNAFLERAAVALESR